MKQRPKCPLCGKAYGSRRTEVRSQTIPKGESPVWERTNLTVVRTDSYPYGNGVRHTQTLWDGESFYLPKSRPFCTSTCAMAYARAAYAKGFRP